MQISSLRQELGVGLRAFAWDQWAQMGVSAATERQDRWVMDPEALLLLTLEVGRDEPRLFDEVLDWLVVNEHLISVQRLRNLAVDEQDRSLAEAALAWTARWKRRARLSPAKTSRRSARPDAQPLFREARSAVTSPDEAFSSVGLLKPLTAPSGKSQAPDLRAPINFAFRLRQLLGVGARAEVMRTLLCSEEPRLSAQVIANGAGYSKRNVQEALISLHQAGVIDVVALGNHRRYGAPRGRWAELLGLDELPGHRDWPQLLHALRRIVRWLTDPRAEGLSDYMRASQARVLMDELMPELRYAGVPAPDGPARGTEYWSQFEATARAAADALS